MTRITQDRIKITVASPAGVSPSHDGPWSKFTGGEGTSEVSRHREEAGGARFADAGQTEIGDITVERFFHAERDAALMEAYKAGQKWPGTTVTQTYLDEANNAIPGSQIIWSNCVCVGMTPPEADSDGSENGMLQVVWATA